MSSRRLLDPAKGLMTATKSGPLNLDETREGSLPLCGQPQCSTDENGRLSHQTLFH